MIRVKIEKEVAKMSDLKKNFDAVKNLAFLSQIGLSLVLPIVLFLMLASYLQNKFGMGDWTTLVALILGLVSGVSSFISFLRYAYNEAKKSEENERGDS